jgi:hypothetical protein
MHISYLDEGNKAAERDNRHLGRFFYGIVGTWSGQGK